jgi:intein/homing endonuclease
MAIKDKYFEQLKEDLLSSIDPVYWVEKNLTIDGKPFKLSDGPWKPFADIYRYAGMIAIQRTAKPMVCLKSRQVGGTVMANAIELYLMDNFGKNTPQMRVMHAFPTKHIAEAFSKTKFMQMVESSRKIPSDKINQTTSYMLSKYSKDSSIYLKNFENNNHIWIEYTGLTGERLRGKTIDVFIADECFPYEQFIETNNGKVKIGKLYDMWSNKEMLPLVKTYNESNDAFEYKEIINAWNRGEKELILVKLNNRKIKCTPNHKFLTTNGWIAAENLKSGDLVLTTSPITGQINKQLNDDQYQIILGSFLGDGHLSKHGENKYRLAEIHGMSQESYARWKSSMFSAEPYIVENNGYAQKNAIKFSTKLFCLKNNLPKTKDNCPQWVLDDLDARGLAIWFMDDGDSSHRISTCSFDEDSQKRIVEKLKSLGIDCSYKHYYKKDGRMFYYIYINKDGWMVLINLIKPYLHPNIYYKIKQNYIGDNDYHWNNEFKQAGLVPVKSVEYINDKAYVYDIAVKDNHNFIATSVRHAKNAGGIIVHNCQDMSSATLSNSTKMLNQANWGPISEGVQIYFGTPKRKGSDFNKIWNSSSQQYYYLGCEKCNEHFPLYTYGSDDWEKIWIKEFIVQCTKCGHQQDKREAASRGKWIASKDPNDPSVKFVGFHINQLYMPHITKEMVIAQKPNVHPINTERAYKNEVLGEFYDGDASPITVEEIISKCGIAERNYIKSIPPNQKLVLMGIDYGDLNAIEKQIDPDTFKGRSFTTAVILVEEHPGLFFIAFACKFDKNDMESKKNVIDKLMRSYSVNLCVGDIGHSQDFSELMHHKYGVRYITSRAGGKMNSHVAYEPEMNPPEIRFEKDFYYEEMIQQLKNGQIKFPLGNYESVRWLMDHCSNIESKPVMINGIATQKFVKSGQTDGFAALLNAYLAYKHIMTNGFTESMLNNSSPFSQDYKNKPAILASYLPFR